MQSNEFRNSKIIFNKEREKQLMEFCPSSTVLCIIFKSIRETSADRIENVCQRVGFNTWLSLPEWHSNLTHDRVTAGEFKGQIQQIEKMPPSHCTMQAPSHCINIGLQSFKLHQFFEVFSLIFLVILSGVING